MLASLVARFDGSYPVLSRRPRAIAAYVPLVPLVLAPPLALALIVGAGINVLAKAPGFARVWHERGVDIAARLVLVIAAVASVLWVGAGVADILSA